jgi:hypothetical protein
VVPHDKNDRGCGNKKAGSFTDAVVSPLSVFVPVKAMPAASCQAAVGWVDAGRVRLSHAVACGRLLRSILICLS